MQITAKIHHATKAKAEKLATMLEAEYPAIALTYEANEDESQIVAWVVVATEDGTVIVRGPKVPDLAAILAACEDLGIDPEEGLEEGPSGSVVPEGYRVAYREASTNGQTCGDWLAEFLTTECHGVDGFQPQEFQAILDQNAVDQTGKWAKLPESGQKGWVGRWRMNGRQILEKHVALAGFVADARGTKHKLPAEALADLREKHSDWIAKQEKLAAAHGKDAA